MARRLAMLLLALMVAMGVTPAAMACGPSGAPHQMAAAEFTTPVPHEATHGAHAAHEPMAGTSPSTAAHGHDGPAACGHLSCPACLARLPLAPEAPALATRAHLLLHGLALLPAGITPTPPRAPPRSA